MTNLLLISAFFLSGLLGIIVIPNILLVSHKKKLFDIPDARKVHNTPVPRLGGLAFFPAILITVFVIDAIGMFPVFGMEVRDLIETQTFLFLFAGMTILYLTGEVDDLVGLGYRYKFVIQTIAAVLIVLSGTYMHSFAGLFGIEEVPAWLGIAASIFIIIYITNAINLIDGIDGLASGLSIISLLTLTALLIMHSSFTYILLAIATLGILCVFWFYNVFGNARKGHKLFMGDTGSLTLGFILSFLVLHICQADNTASAVTNNWKIIVALSSLLVPLFDVVRVSLHRIRKHRNPFLPDKNHIHHKLMRAGMTRVRSVLITIIAIDVFFIVFNAVLADKINSTILLLIDITIYTAIHIVINYFIRKNNGGPSYIPVEELAKSEPELAKELGLDKTQGADQSVILNGSEESGSSVILNDSEESDSSVILNDSEESDSSVILNDSEESEKDK